MGSSMPYLEALARVIAPGNDDDRTPTTEELHRVRLVRSLVQCLPLPPALTHFARTCCTVTPVSWCVPFQVDMVALLPVVCCTCSREAS